jgi:Streptomyces sporulation and cell division protein, SsgA
MISSGATVSAELGLGFVTPEQTNIPLIGSLYYSLNDPYAIRMAFHIGTGEPIEWVFARDLLAAGLESPEGMGDFKAWPSSGVAGDLAAEGAADEDDAAGHEILNIELSSPSGCAHFETSAAAISEFLQRTYRLVPAGEESGFVDVGAELDDILRQA